MASPYEVKKNPDGKVAVQFEDGYKLDPLDPIAATEELAKARYNTRQDRDQWKQKAEAAQAELDRLKQQPPPQPPPNGQQQSDPQAEQLQNYLLDQHAKALGYNNANEYKMALGRVQQVTSEMENQVIAANFMAACPDFPNTPEAIEAISKRLDENKWDFNQPAMIAAHAMLVREGAYKPLTAEEQNQSWEQGLRNSNRQAPPMPPRGNPEVSNPAAPDPWSMKLDDLRKAALAEGRK